jgi:propionate CoA-transferase
MSKVIGAREAVALVKPGMTLAVGGFVGCGVPEQLLRALRGRYLETKEPKDLFLVYIAGHGANGVGGMNNLALEGLIRKTYSPHMGGLCPDLGALAAKNSFPAFMMPQGVITHLMRAIASKKIGYITTVGLGTFVDPRQDGGKMNQAAWDSGEEYVELIEVLGQEHLIYKTFPLDVCFIRASYGDEDGNLSCEKEANVLSQFETAMAAKNSGGIVIAEVGRVVERGTLNPHNVIVAGVSVDYVVETAPELYKQSLGLPRFMPEVCGDVRAPLGNMAPAPLDSRKVIGRRCAMELEKNTLVNLGIGIPETVSAVEGEEGIASYLTMTVEAGVLGGVPLGGGAFGCAANPIAIYKHPDMFDVYDGGALALTCLGAAEINAMGDVNVSKFGGRIVGPGGFINIAQGAKKVCFCGNFVAGKFKYEVRDGKLNIIEDTDKIKFVDQIEQITFSGKYAAARSQPVYYVTERAVFQLTAKGIMLVEIAPGVDLEKHILSKMGFKPLISENLKLMDERIFHDRPMGLGF